MNKIYGTDTKNNEPNIEQLKKDLRKALDKNALKIDEINRKYGLE